RGNKPRTAGPSGTPRQRTCRPLRGNAASRPVETHRLGAAVLRADHDGAGQLVVPALLLRVESDPDDAEEQRDRGYEVRDVTADRLADAHRISGSRIHYARGDRHLSGRRLLVDPEQDYRNEGHDP